MAEKVLIVKYGEIAMRGNNRYIFINRLISAIRRNIDPLGSYYVVRDPGRLIVEDRGGELDYDLLIPRIEPIFGLVAVCPGVRLGDMSFETILEESYQHMKELYGDEEITFKVNTRRANQGFTMPSMEVNAEVGGYLLERLPNLKVDVRKPDVVLNIEIRNSVYLHSKVVKTYGGLPYGSSGKGVSLLSGGIDSPVATWMMAKRGVEVEGVYFHSPPYTSEWAKEKVIDLAKRIADFTGEFRLYVVPFTELQLYLLDNVAHDKLTIHLKRAMMRAGEMIAKKDDAMALITGESVGQVASQTMQGIYAINAVCEMPVLRPLAGMDKQEIVNLAQRIGTFEISARPYEDCCTVFVAKHPVTKPRLSFIEKSERRLTELDRLLEESVQNAEIIDL
ncbi:tRNA uracil 4-sulfurtransferase ThiI [Anaerotignum sp. MB30-C6]|uniref:tRNA uracil 4-sulfurtransferase ThiI n=1 Tax=Anaerotignum sp. MB30-C6 TaxID=3070814 RepID=UPI0027DC2ADC|nr:tRNA uracil 4-sulfurtransferase ThiI [Anaerotignum sp. MB30-C6]WMI81378.1 tRNA uracil 4-sulfurtransferase ThiI [Anaerotignum sp. MB30-C6]